jgi:hypothetical protein
MASTASGQITIRWRAELAHRDEALRARNLTHLAGLRDEPGALLTPSGRVLASQPLGWLPDRLVLPREGDRVDLGAHGEGLLEPLPDAFLLRIPPRTRQSKPALALRFLGAQRPTARLAGREIRLTLRSAELLTLLALHPGGLTAEQLATELYGPSGNPVSVRGEIHRLRAQLNPKVLRTQPYRLDATVNADFRQVRAALAAGRLAEAVDGYRGALLPRSEAPAIRDEREELFAILRRMVIAGGDTHQMWQLADVPDTALDAELGDKLLRVLPATDPRRAVLLAKMDGLTD